MTNSDFLFTFLILQIDYELTIRHCVLSQQIIIMIDCNKTFFFFLVKRVYIITFLIDIYPEKKNYIWKSVSKKVGKKYNKFSGNATVLLFVIIFTKPVVKSSTITLICCRNSFESAPSAAKKTHQI